MRLCKKCAAVTAFVLLFCTLLPLMALGHPGRTDLQGGHYDRQNGGYHYHHGYPAHDHPGGVCPFEADVQDVEEEYDFDVPAYDDGDDDGYDYAYEDDQKAERNETVSQSQSKQREGTNSNPHSPETIAIILLSIPFGIGLFIILLPKIFQSEKLMDWLAPLFGIIMTIGVNSLLFGLPLLAFIIAELWDKLEMRKKDHSGKTGISFLNDPVTKAIVILLSIIGIAYSVGAINFAFILSGKETQSNINYTCASALIIVLLIGIIAHIKLWNLKPKKQPNHEEAWESPLSKSSTVLLDKQQTAMSDDKTPLRDTFALLLPMFAILAAIVLILVLLYFS